MLHTNLLRKGECVIMNQVQKDSALNKGVSIQSSLQLQAMVMQTVGFLALFVLSILFVEGFWLPVLIGGVFGLLVNCLASTKWFDFSMETVLASGILVAIFLPMIITFFMDPGPYTDGFPESIWIFIKIFLLVIVTYIPAWFVMIAEF